MVGVVGIKEKNKYYIMKNRFIAQQVVKTEKLDIEID